MIGTSYAAGDPVVLTRRADAKYYDVGINQSAEMSTNGRWVAFESSARLTPDDKNKTKDVYLHDRTTKKTIRIDVGDLKRVNGAPSIDGAGTIVALHSYRPGALKINAKFRGADIYIYDIAKKEGKFISFDKDTLAVGEAMNPVLGDNPDLLLFTSNATSYMEINKPAIRGIYLYNRDSRDLRLVGKSKDGKPANRLCGWPRMNLDGGKVAFLSSATNLAEGLPVDSLGFHLYLADTTNGNVERLDSADHGFNGDDWAITTYDTDASATTFVWEGRKRNTAEPIRSLDVSDLFLFNRTTGQTKLITKGIFAGKSKSPSISANGRYVAFILSKGSNKNDPQGLVVADLEKDVWRRVADGKFYAPVISRNGCVIAYESEKTHVLRHIYAVNSPFAEEMQCPPLK